jgi:hypothetical protein
MLWQQSSVGIVTADPSNLNLYCHAVCYLKAANHGSLFLKTNLLFYAGF